MPLLAPHSGYLQTVDVDDIAELAAASRYTALLVTFVGDYVTAGACSAGAGAGHRAGRARV